MTEEVGTEIPGEGGTSSLNPELHKQAQVERATQKGWQPLDAWVESGKDAADWVDAPEFLGRQKLFDKLHDSRRQITKLERDIAAMGKHFSDMEENAYQRALKELREQQAIAVENQDTAAVIKVTDEISDLKAQQAAKVQKAQAEPQGQLTEEFVQWKEENPWFEADQEMTQDAISIGIGHAAANKNKTQKEVLDFVKTKIMKIYPEKFQKKPAQRKEAPVVESGKGSAVDSQAAASQKKAGKLTVNDLDDRERSVMQTFIKRGVLADRAKKLNTTQQQVYLDDLAKAKGL